MTNIFLVYTPFHAEYARAIIKQHFVGNENFIFNHFDKDLRETPGDPTVVKNAGVSLTGSLKALRGFKNEIGRQIKRGGEVNIFIPHTLGILSNYAYHTQSKKHSNLKVHVFYEGVIVFYPYSHGYIDNLKYYVSRWLVSLLLGILYVPDKNLLVPADGRITSIYSPFLKIAAPREKIVITPLTAVSFEPESNCGLILGTVLGRGQDQELLRIVEAIYAQIKKLGLEKVYYKEHPLNRSDVFREVAERNGVRIIPIEDKSPIETIIHLYRPSFVFSSWSSGLINLRNMLPGKTAFYCFVTETITKGPEKNLVSIFTEEGINVSYV